MFCALLGHTGERLQDHWSSGFQILNEFDFSPISINRINDEKYYSY